MMRQAHGIDAAVANNPEICYTPGSVRPHCWYKVEYSTGRMDWHKPGTYILALRLGSDQGIAVGRLGEVEFPAGWYLYVGSALGPGGLRARLKRHRRRLESGKRAHWHIDYLREHSTWGGAWGRSSHLRLECLWASALRRLPGAKIMAPGFGASDCRCSAHLVHVPVLPGDDWFLGELGAGRIDMEPDQLAELLQVLGTGNEKAREAAALALGRLGPAAIGPLTEMLAMDDADTRWWAARGLAEVGGHAAVEPLAGVLADPDPDMRACAALALGRVGDGQAAPAVAALLADDSAFVASIAADALSMIGEPAVEPLAAMLAEGSAHARLLAVRALSRIGSQSALTPLFGALEDPSYLVRYYAQEALEALGVGMVYMKP